MKFNVNQQELQQALNYCQGIIEKRSTLQILSNVLLDLSNSKLTITATDLDLIFIHQINNVDVIEEGKTTTTSSIMYDIVRKFSSGKKINFLGKEKLKKLKQDGITRKLMGVMIDHNKIGASLREHKHRSGKHFCHQHSQRGGGSFLSLNQ